MAMNKKEKIMVENLKIIASLHFTNIVKKDVPIPSSKDGIVNGWGYNAYCQTLSKTCSNSVYHSNHNWDKANQQEPMEQYSTELKALKAMRSDIEFICAMKLRKIDIMIEKLDTTGQERKLKL